MVEQVLKKNNLPGGIFAAICGPGRYIGELLINDPRLSLISFTGSTAVSSCCLAIDLYYPITVVCSLSSIILSLSSLQILSGYNITRLVQELVQLSTVDSEELFWSWEETTLLSVYTLSLHLHSVRPS